MAVSFSPMSEYLYGGRPLGIKIKNLPHDTAVDRAKQAKLQGKAKASEAQGGGKGKRKGRGKAKPKAAAKGRGRGRGKEPKPTTPVGSSPVQAAPFQPSPPPEPGLMSGAL